jgi:hypothetical protein
MITAWRFLDFYHAAEHLSDTCKQLYGEQTPRFHEKYRRWLKAVYRGKASEVIVELKGILNATRALQKRRVPLDSVPAAVDSGAYLVRFRRAECGAIPQRSRHCDRG